MDIRIMLKIAIKFTTEGPLVYGEHSIRPSPGLYVS